jgi:hypothetical protein
MSGKEQSSWDISDQDEKVVQIRKGLDGPQPEGEDWLTPMKCLTEFAVAYKGYKRTVFLEHFIKIVNYTTCIEVLDSYDRRRFVIAERFCETYELVEIIEEHETLRSI